MSTLSIGQPKSRVDIVDKVDIKSGHFLKDLWHLEDLNIVSRHF